jgi:hypothetical protein
MVILLVAALLGGFTTLIVLLPHGMLVALVGALFGGSFLTLMAGLLLAYFRTKAERQIEPASNMLTETQVTRSTTR